MEPRVVTADNAGLFTLEGTRTFLLGRRRVALVDPGPDMPEHRRRLLDLLRAGEAESVWILVTHDHPDHAAGAPALARALREDGIELRIGAADPKHRQGDALSALSPTALHEGDEIPTDAGRLAVVETPGHARDHLAFHWTGGRALFAGDLVLGRGDTAWVGSYAGCVADYLESLRRVESLGLRQIHPAHGPSIDDPIDAVERYRAHRLERIRQVQARIARDPGRPDEALVGDIYGDELPESLRGAALWSVRAILDHLGTRPFPRPGPEGEDPGQTAVP